MSTTVPRGEGLRKVVLFMTVSYPFLVHLSIISGHIRLGVWMLFAVSTAYSIRLLGSGEFGPTKLLAPGTAALALLSLFLDDATVLYLPPIVMAIALLQLFGHTLLPHAEPLICQFAHLGGIKDEQYLRYARRLTWVWTLFFAFMLIESIFLALFAPIEVWSLFANLINYILIAALFIVEYVFRMLYFRRMPSVQAAKQALEVIKRRSHKKD